ncbi:hypothetical protein BC567DRAFT_226818 [Phyllosticta citribraziliensis]
MLRRRAMWVMMTAGCVWPLTAGARWRERVSSGFSTTRARVRWHIPKRRRARGMQASETTTQSRGPFISWFALAKATLDPDHGRRERREEEECVIHILADSSLRIPFALHSLSLCLPSLSRFFSRFVSLVRVALTALQKDGSTALRYTLVRTTRLRHFSFPFRFPFPLLLFYPGGLSAVGVGGTPHQKIGEEGGSA